MNLSLEPGFLDFDYLKCWRLTGHITYVTIQLSFHYAPFFTRFRSARWRRATGNLRTINRWGRGICGLKQNTVSVQEWPWRSRAFQAEWPAVANEKVYIINFLPSSNCGKVSHHRPFNTNIFSSPSSDFSEYFICIKCRFLTALLASQTEALGKQWKVAKM